MDSKTVFALRNEAKNLEGISKLNKLTEALNLAQRLFSFEPYDEWIQKAFAYTLIDLSKYYIYNSKINQAEVYFNQLLSINFREVDEIIENQKNFLRPKFDANYSEVKKAEEFSKGGNHQDALSIFKKLIAENRLTELHHEAYGWIIYRYIKDKGNELNSIQVRTFLKDYMNLKNERPSMLHSQILNFAVGYSKEHKDFKLYNFYLLWNPQFLSYEDKNENHKDGKTFPSLISRIFREFIDSDIEIDISEVIEKTPISKVTSLDLLREPYFWKLFNAHKENKQSELWNIFNKYNQTFSKYEKSKWHSEILSIAERYMQETEAWRFLDFFKIWNPENLLDEDWKEVKNDDKVYKPLAIKCLKKTFEIVKTQSKDFDENWLIPIYSKAVKVFPDDEWLLREKALIHIKNKELELAIKIYKQLVLELSDKHYIWQEFTNCIVSNNSLKIGMLSKALSLEKNEDFLGDIHLDLAKSLIDENLLENALVELEAYKKHREIKGWKLSSLYDALNKIANSIKQCLKDNQELYKKFIPFAENFAYADFDWKEVVLVDKWKDEKGKERLTFTDGKDIEFSIRKTRFGILAETKLGQIYKFKLHKQEIKKEIKANSFRGSKLVIKKYEYTYIYHPLIIEKSDKENWDILEDTFAVVDYINKDKNIVHAITSDSKQVFFVQIKNEWQIGNFFRAKCYTKNSKDKKKIELRQINKINKQEVISKFQTEIALVDGVNEQKQLFHFVITSKLQGIVRYGETTHRPKEGDFIKLIFTTKTDKENKLRIKVLDIELTEKINNELRKDITDLLEVKFKNYNPYDEDINDEYEDCEGYSSYESWKGAIRSKFIYKNNSIPSQEDYDKIFSMIKSIIEKEEDFNLGFNKEKQSNSNNQKKTINDIFKKVNNLFDEKIFSDTSKEKKSEKDLLWDKEIYNNLYRIAWSVFKDNEELKNTLIISNKKSKIPDFAFIGVYYVPKYLLEKNTITNDCVVKATIIYVGDKWKVIEVQKV